MLITRCSGSGNRNVLLNLIKEQHSDNPIDKTYLLLEYQNEFSY